MDECGTTTGNVISSSDCIWMHIDNKLYIFKFVKLNFVKTNLFLFYLKNFQVKKKLKS